MTPHAEVLRRLREYIYARWPHQEAASAQLGCSYGHLNMILCGKRPAPDWLLSEVGLTKRRVWIYYDADDTPRLPCGAAVYTSHNRPDCWPNVEDMQ